MKVMGGILDISKDMGGISDICRYFYIFFHMRLRHVLVKTDNFLLEIPCDPSFIPRDPSKCSNYVLT